jgi:hypothetical protein
MGHTSSQLHITVFCTATSPIACCKAAATQAQVGAKHASQTLQQKPQLPHQPTNAKMHGAGSSKWLQ